MTKQDNTNGDKHAILLADDEKGILELLELTFSGMFPGYRIHKASTSSDALERLKEGKIAALVVDGGFDSHLGGLNGLQLASCALNSGVPNQAIYIFTGDYHKYSEEASKLRIKTLPKPQGIKALKGYLDFYLNQSAIA